jgi:hypothetical protein
VIEYLDRIGNLYHCEYWVVRVDGALGNARLYDTDSHLSEDIEGEVTPWLGFEHEHLVPIVALERDPRRIIVITGDERGPSFVQAAELLQDPQERISWAVGELAGVCEALGSLRFRDRTFVHRNVCPTQIVVDVEGRAKLKALVPQDGRPRGTAWTGRVTTIKPIGWMSPEQCMGYTLSPASDVFSLASTLYTAITLTRPFKRDTEMETLMAIRDAAPPPRPDCDKRLADLVLDNLSRGIENRDPHPAAFGMRLRAIVDQTPPALRAKVAAMRPDKKPAPHESAAITGFRCAKKWDQLSPTGTSEIRYCGECKHDVVQVRSLGALIPLLGQRCISYVPE